MRWSVVVLALIGCAAKSRGHVEVVAYDQSDPSSMQRSALGGALVSFMDRDGSTTSTHTDGDGHASGEVEPGGSVWLAYAPGSSDNTTEETVFAYTDVEPPQMLVFGSPPHAPIATMTFSGTPPSGTNFEVYTSCGSWQPDSSMTVMLDDRCVTTVEVLAIATVLGSNPQTYNYAYLAAQPIMDGATIAIPDSAWQPPQPITVQFANLDGATLTGYYPSITTSSGFLVAPQSSTSFTASMPLVGALRVVTGLRRDGVYEEISVEVPAVASPTIDFHAIGAPWVSSAGGSWTADDVAGALGADVQVTTYQWAQPIANYQTSLIAQLVGPVQAPGAVPFIRLPDELSKYQPGADFQIQSEVSLVRVVSPDAVDVRYVGEIVGSRGNAAPDDFHGSVAVGGSSI